MTILTLVFFVNVFLWLAYTGGKLSRITPLVFSLHIYIGVMVLPGLIALILFQPEVLVIKKEVSSESVKTVFAFATIIAVISVFWVRFERRTLRNMRSETAENIPFSRLQMFSFLALLGLVTVVSARGISNTPLYHTILLDFNSAALAKFNFMNGHLPKAPEILNQMLRYLLPLLTCYIAYNFSDIRKPKLMKILWFLLILACSLVFLGIDGHKAPPLLLIVTVLLLIAVREQKFLKLKNIFIPIVFFLMFFSLFSASITLGDRNISEVFLERIFFGQTAGAIFIVDRFDPNFELIKHGFIGASYVFSDLPEHAHSSIMKTVYGVSNTNVNMNSIFIGEAFSWGGIGGAFASVVFVAFYVPTVTYIISVLSKRNAGLYFPLSAVFFVFYFPILQGFNSFLYGRNVIFFVVMASVFSLTRTFVLRRRPAYQ